MAQRGDFASVAAEPHNPMWRDCVKREKEIYSRGDDIRTEFARDYNRILHSTAYRRLKHKTQVFFATKNDHICTRIEHVNHVQSISYTIACALGLNVDLTMAIAIGHDIGHAPFGHKGESVLKELASTHSLKEFWHERNSLRFADDIETLPDTSNQLRNLSLTYAVRDGLICHCGEVDENGIRPREDLVALETLEAPGQLQAATWEGCVVKLTDKIAYLGRDIEDAIELHVLRWPDLRSLQAILREHDFKNIKSINNTVLIHEFVIDVCRRSSPEAGICLSPEHFELMKQIKEFNYERIYGHPRLETYKKYVELVLGSIFSELRTSFDKGWRPWLPRLTRQRAPSLYSAFGDWLIKYGDAPPDLRHRRRYQNWVIYQLDSQESYLQAVIDFMAGMTDDFALRAFAELTSFS